MAENIRVAIADLFWEQSLSLPSQQRRKLQGFITRFRQAPTSSGFNYEKINDACVDNYRSVRLDQAYRCIVMAPRKGDVYCLLWVDHHDDAYSWARRTKVEVNPVTGTMQIYNTEYIDAPAADTPPEYKSTKPQTLEAPASTEPLFNLDDTRLLKIGVPESMLEAVMALQSKTQLQALQGALPVEAFEALELFAGGVDWHDILAEYGTTPKEKIDTEDYAAAIERDASKRRFHIVDSDEELQQILAAPLEKWRVYLHPSQRKLVDGSWNGPVRVTGGAGTGKTVVAMHRAVWLVRNSLQANRKVLFLTYNTNLAGDIAENLKKITTPEEHSRIEVINIDAWVSRYLKDMRYTSRIVMDNQLDDLWSDLFAERGSNVSGKQLPESFFTEEWERIILPNRINSRQEYLRVSRAGRGVALSRPQRAAIWEYFDEMRASLQQRGWRTWQDAMLDARDLIEQAQTPQPYQHVVVDEAQDMGSEALELIRALVTETKNDLFLVGDGNQRIYPRKAVMGQCGINIKGRGKKLKINYRTTEEIRRFATNFMTGQAVDNLDGQDETKNDYLSLTRGPDPELKGFNTDDEEIAWIIERAQALVKDGGELSDCCVLLRVKWLRNKYAKAFISAGLKAVTLDARNDNRTVAGIRVANMHRIKGLEFRHIFLAAMNDGVVPNKKAVEGSEDPTELRDNERSERALIHVAASRAIETLTVTWYGQRSSYL